MKAFLIYPPSPLINREDRCQVPSGKVPIAPALPPTDLMYMAAAAEAVGCECKIVDYSIDNHNINSFIRDLQKFRPDFLVISATTPTLNLDLSVCRRAKELLPGLKIIAKGAHFLRFDEKVMCDYPDVDILLRGEPEPIIEAILSGISEKNIPGITWRKSEEIIRNRDAGYLDDLDKLPFPARHLIDNSRYVRPDNGKIQGIIKCSRGCPYNCFFCLATPVSGRKVRMRSPESIIEEVRHCIGTYGMKDFIFWSDVFNFDNKWVTALCEEILSSGLKFTWAANMRADNVDDEILRMMRKAGCSLVSIGVESGDQSILDRIGKRITLSQISNAFSLLRRHKIASFAYFVIGLPWETRESVEKTIRFAISLKSDFANFFVATPFPGTAFFEYAVENGLFENSNPYDNELYTDAYAAPTVTGHFLKSEEITMLYNETIKRFYLRPGYIAGRILKIRSFTELLGYCRTGYVLMSGSR